MIFALVGMQHDTQDPIFTPDYHRTTEELYTLVSYFMNTKYGLNILCEAGNQNRTINHLPSWVIDWYVNIPHALSRKKPPRSASESSLALLIHYLVSMLHV